jgi:hypothetical protein
LAVPFGEAPPTNPVTSLQPTPAAQVTPYHPEPPTVSAGEPEFKATTVIGMAIDQASGKVRSKGVGDEEEDYALPIYAAKIPVRTVIGEIETCPRMPQGVARPPGLDGFTPGRRMDEIMLETRDTTGLP